MAEEDKGGSGGFILGLLLGVALGGVVGILLAPQAGAEARASLRERSTRMRERARSLGETGQEILREAVSEGRVAAAKARREMEDWVQRTRTDAGHD